MGNINNIDKKHFKSFYDILYLNNNIIYYWERFNFLETQIMFDNNRHDLSDLKIERMLVWKLFVK